MKITLAMFALKQFKADRLLIFKELLLNKLHPAV